MDAAYLKENVFTALSEALVSMAVELPDDKVEYLGKYLIKYVERKKCKEQSNFDLQEISIRVNEEQKSIDAAQLSAEASRMKVQEDLASQQAVEHIKFAELNKDISESLLQVINSIEDLDMAAEAAVAEIDESEAELDEEGNPSVMERSVTSALNEEDEANANEGKSRTVNNMTRSVNALKVITSLLQPGSAAEKSLYSLQWWKKNPPTNSENNFECDMDEKVLSFFSILSTFLMLESAVCADPQTLEPSWKVMRMRLIPELLRAIVTYDCMKKISIPYNCSILYIKEFCTSKNVLDSSSYPVCFPVLKLLSIWLHRAVNARENAISYYKEKGSIIENIIEDNQSRDDDDDE